MNIRKLGLTALAIVSSTSALAADTSVKANAYIDTYYQYNFNKPAVSSNPTNAPQNSLRFNDRTHRQFDIAQARVGVSRAAVPVGFDLQLGLGSTIYALNGVDGDNLNAYRLIRKATINFEQSKFMLNIGRFDADFGMERIDSVDNWNYSRSLAFSYIQPLFFTGLLAGYDFGSGLSAHLGLANGTNRFANNNYGQTYIGKVNYNMGSSNFALTYVVGPEKDSNGKELRHSVNANMKHSYSSTMAVGVDLNFVRGEGELVQASPEVRRGASRLGAALYGQTSLMTDHMEALRFEWLSDREGVIAQNNGGTRYFTLTGTHRYKFNQNLSFWGEVRWDTANSDRFQDGNGMTSLNRNNQVTALVAATLSI